MNKFDWAIRKRFFDLQMFADDGDGGGADGNGADGAGDSAAGAQDQKPAAKYTDEDVDKILNKKFAEWQKNQEKKVSEAERLSKMTAEEKATFIDLLKKEPRRFIAQEVIDFLDIDILEDGQFLPRKADLRAFVLMADEPMVWKSGLTRFSRNPDSFIVNSSQGGGFKDTWVLSR